MKSAYLEFKWLSDDPCSFAKGFACGCFSFRWYKKFVTFFFFYVNVYLSARIERVGKDGDEFSLRLSHLHSSRVYGYDLLNFESFQEFGRNIC